MTSSPLSSVFIGNAPSAGLGRPRSSRFSCSGSLPALPLPPPPPPWVRRHGQRTCCRARERAGWWCAAEHRRLRHLESACFVFGGKLERIWPPEVGQSGTLRRRGGGGGRGGARRFLVPLELVAPAGAGALTPWLSGSRPRPRPHLLPPGARRRPATEGGAGAARVRLEGLLAAAPAPGGAWWWRWCGPC